MKALLEKALRIVVVLLALNFLLVAGIVAYAALSGKLNSEKMDAVAQVLQGYKAVSPENYEIVRAKEVGTRAMKEEIETMIAARSKFKEREESKYLASSNLSMRLDKTLGEIDEKIKDMERTRKEILDARLELEKQRQEEAELVSGEHFQKRREIYEGMDPEKAAANLLGLSDEQVARYLSQMKKRSSTRLADAISDLEDARVAAETLTDADRRLPKVLELVKDYSSAQGVGQ